MSVEESADGTLDIFVFGWGRRLKSAHLVEHVQTGRAAASARRAGR